MAKLMRQNRNVAFVTSHRRCSAEAGFVRHPDGVGGRLIQRPVTTVSNDCAGCRNEGIEARTQFYRPEIRNGNGFRKAINLRTIENC